MQCEVFPTFAVSSKDSHGGELGAGGLRILAWRSEREDDNDLTVKARLLLHGDKLDITAKRFLFRAVRLDKPIMTPHQLTHNCGPQPLASSNDSTNVPYQSRMRTRRTGHGPCAGSIPDVWRVLLAGRGGRGRGDWQGRGRILRESA